MLDDDQDDPILLTPEGTPADTWREGYPYGTRMAREQYELEQVILTAAIAAGVLAVLDLLATRAATSSRRCREP